MQKNALCSRIMYPAGKLTFRIGETASSGKRWETESLGAENFRFLNWTNRRVGNPAAICKTFASDIRMFSFYYYHKVLKHKRIPYVYRKEGYSVKGVNAFVTERYFLYLEERKNSTSSFNMKVNAVRDLQEYIIGESAD